MAQFPCPRCGLDREGLESRCVNCSWSPHPIENDPHWEQQTPIEGDRVSSDDGGSLDELPGELLPASPVPCRSFWRALGWCLILLCGHLAIAIYMATLRGRPIEASLVFGAVVSITTLGTLLLAGYFIYLYHSNNKKRIIAWCCPRTKHIGLLLLILLPSFFSSLAINTSIYQWFISVQQTAPNDGVAAQGLAAESLRVTLMAQQNWLVLIFGFCIFPAIGEELFFRVFVGRGLVMRYGPLVGVLLTSLLFAVVHLLVFEFASLFLMGVLFHCVYLATKSIVVPMIFHGLHNFLAMIWIKFVVNGQFMPVDTLGLHLPTLLIVVSVFTLATVLWLFYRTRTGWFDEQGDRWNPPQVTAEIPPTEEPMVFRSQKAGKLNWVVLWVAFGVFSVLAWQTARSWLALTHAHRAYNLYASGNLPAATQSSELALSYNSDLPWVRICRGWVFIGKGEFDRSIEQFSKAIELDPDSPFGYANRASAWLQKGDHQQGLDDSQRAIDLGASTAQIYANRAAAHVGLGNFKQAHRDAKKALTFPAGFATAYQYLGAAEYELGNSNQAVTDLTTALRKQLGIKESESGIRIGKVITGKSRFFRTNCNLNAKRVGLRGGDVILNINGQGRLDESRFMAYILQRTKPRDKITLTILRDGSRKKFTYPLKRLNVSN